MRFALKHPLSSDNQSAHPLLFVTVVGIGVALSIPPTMAEPGTLLQEIVIEAAQLGSTEATPEASGSAYSVVTREEIERRQIRHAADALRALPGVHLNATGGSGSLTELRLRGGETRHTKVLIDGVEVNGMDSGGYDFSTLLAADIERIEVLRGPQSGIHGGNALAGVVNIITRKGGKPRVSLSAEGGSFNTQYLSGNMSTGSEDGYVSISGAVTKTDGFNIAETGNEDDGSSQGTVFARAGYAFSPFFRVDGMLRRQESEADIDTDTNWDGKPDDVTGYTSDRKQTLGNLAATLTLFDGMWVQKLNGSLFDDEYESVSPGSLYTNEGDRTKFSYLSQFNLTTGPVKHTLSSLVDHTEESFSNPVFTGERSRSQTGYVGEYRWNYLDQVFVDGNLRYDDNDRFDDVMTYRIGASYLYRPLDSRLHTSYGKGIQNPTMFQLYGYSDQFNSNPNLLPEESLGFDVGLEKGFLDHRMVFDVTYFQADLTNKISSTKVSGIYTPINLSGTSHRKGVELTSSFALSDTLTLSANYTYTDATDADGIEEVRRPEHQAGVNLTWLFFDGRGKANVEAIYRGEVLDNDWATWPASLVTVDDYTVVNLAASYQLTDNLELFARAENLFDADYQEIYGYETAPLAAYAGIKVRLGDSD